LYGLFQKIPNDFPRRPIEHPQAKQSIKRRASEDFQRFKRPFHTKNGWACFPKPGFSPERVWPHRGSIKKQDVKVSLQKFNQKSENYRLARLIFDGVSGPCPNRKFPVGSNLLRNDVVPVGLSVYDSEFWILVLKVLQLLAQTEQRKFPFLEFSTFFNLHSFIIPHYVSRKIHSKTVLEGPKIKTASTAGSF
jgi:hypothetical protein